ncbi:uncharacterized protein LOC143460073 [Clavelina lepadiformis]|uniref:uncharacterized protein LOC143460073 n=1 Tax=Clavelina lepadiformis TaxID=159417 RepID=UPI00404378AB
MKVVVAGYAKTGTKSMQAALIELGYKVYDSVDHFWYHGNQWNKIFTAGGCIEDFKAMYEDVDAVTDFPACIFWEEISSVFPDCKIILTVRDEESWCKSWHGQIREAKSNLIFQLMQVLSPTGWKLFRSSQLTFALSPGISIRHPFDYSIRSKMVDIRVFKTHQTYCLQNAPKDRLLVYRISEGWEPLCKFLGKEIPEKEFPHENKGATLIAKLMKTHPATIRIQREMFVTLSILGCMGVYGIYKLCANGRWRLCQDFFQRFLIK